MRFSLADLAEWTGGQLRLGLMPPLDGELTFVPRIVVTLDAVRPGDVLWCLTQDCCDAELAFLRGALGAVVTHNSIEPWPGRFSLQVDDPITALARLVAAIANHDQEESSSGSAELKVLQLCDMRGADIYPLTCGQSAKGHAARRCQRRAA